MLYLSGRMRSLPLFNFPQFHEAAKWLREQGYEVYNPAEHEDPSEVADSLERDPVGLARELFAEDTRVICMEADGVAMLPGWDKSKGARAEKALAEAIGLQVLFLRTHQGKWWVDGQV